MEFAAQCANLFALWFRRGSKWFLVVPSGSARRRLSCEVPRHFSLSALATVRE